MEAPDQVAIGRPPAIACCKPLPSATIRGTLVPMARPIIISVPHQLGRAEAHRRIEAGFAKIINLLPGSSGAPSERWDGDRLIFSVAALGQTVSGVIDVLDAAVVMEIELPGVLRVIAGGLKERLQKMGQLLLTRK